MRTIVCDVCFKVFTYDGCAPKKHCSPECAAIAAEMFRNIREDGYKEMKTNYIKSDNDIRIIEIAKKAREAGLSYGKYVARYESTKQYRRKK